MRASGYKYKVFERFKSGILESQVESIMGLIYIKCLWLSLEEHLD